MHMGLHRHMSIYWALIHAMLLYLPPFIGAIYLCVLSPSTCLLSAVQLLPFRPVHRSLLSYFLNTTFYVIQNFR
jgi:hypothetical protein